MPFSDATLKGDETPAIDTTSEAYQVYKRFMEWAIAADVRQEHMTDLCYTAVFQHEHGLPWVPDFEHFGFCSPLANGRCDLVELEVYCLRLQDVCWGSGDAGLRDMRAFAELGVRLWLEPTPSRCINPYRSTFEASEQPHLEKFHAYVRRANAVYVRDTDPEEDNDYRLQLTVKTKHRFMALPLPPDYTVKRSELRIYACDFSDVEPTEDEADAMERLGVVWDPEHVYE
jgi:hypothetical protein